MRKIAKHLNKNEKKKKEYYFIIDINSIDYYLLKVTKSIFKVLKQSLEYIYIYMLQILSREFLSSSLLNMNLKCLIFFFFFVHIKH